MFDSVLSRREAKAVQDRLDVVDATAARYVHADYFDEDGFVYSSFGPARQAYAIDTRYTRPNAWHFYGPDGGTWQIENATPDFKAKLASIR